MMEPISQVSIEFVTIFQKRKGPLIVFPNYIMCQSIPEQPTTAEETTE